MDFPENITNTMRRIFDDGLDEILIFAFIFIFILLTGHENNGFEDNTIGSGILPIIIIGVFLLLFTSFSRTETSPETGR